MGIAEPTAYKPVGVAQRGRKWVVLLAGKSQGSVVVEGDALSETAEHLTEAYDQVALDARQRVYLRRRPQPNALEMIVDIRERPNSPPIVHKLKEPNASLLSNEPELLQTSSGLRSVHGASLKATKAASNESVYDLNAGVVQRLFSFGLGDGTYVTLGSISESLTLYNSSGQALRSVRLNTARAFQLLGLSPPEPSERLGITRVIWAAYSQGAIRVSLSETPVGFAHVAMFDVQTGSFQRLIQAELPFLPERRDASNPKGVMIQTLAAFDGQLVVVDREARCLAMY